SIIISNGWKRYGNIDKYGYKQYEINHTITYQRYIDQMSIHKNTIEGKWNSIKELRPARYRDESLIDPYLNFY
ncbi:hypothetical protein COBT_003755, partial [Conglomerata obtusa]